MSGNKPDLATLAFDTEVRNTLPRQNIPQTQPAQLFLADGVIEQGGEYRPIADAFERVRRRRIEQPPRLRIAEGRGAALVIVRCRALHAVHGIADDRIALTEIVKERGEGRQLAAYSGWPSVRTSMS